MAMTFRHANAFNSDLSKWNTAQVTDMTRTFQAAYPFNSDLGKWNTAQVTDMNNMFHGARAFNNGCANGEVCPINTWVTSSVTSMDSMFLQAWAFNQDVSYWDTSQVTSIKKMFDSGGNTFNGSPILMTFNQPLDNFLTTSQITDATNLVLFDTTWYGYADSLYDYIDSTNGCKSTPSLDTDNTVTWSTKGANCPDRAAAPPVMCKDPGTTGYTMTNTDLDKDNFDVTGVCADDYGGSVTAEACTEAGEYTVSGCAPLCTGVTCNSTDTGKNTKIPNIYTGDADTCCGPAWVVRCLNGTKADLTLTEPGCVGDPSSYSDSVQLRDRWRELNTC